MVFGCFGWDSATKFSMLRTFDKKLTNWVYFTWVSRRQTWFSHAVIYVFLCLLHFFHVLVVFPTFMWYLSIHTLSSVVERAYVCSIEEAVFCPANVGRKLQCWGDIWCRRWLVCINGTTIQKSSVSNKTCIDILYNKTHTHTLCKFMFIRQCSWIEVFWHFFARVLIVCIKYTNSILR